MHFLLFLACRIVRLGVLELAQGTCRPRRHHSLLFFTIYNHSINFLKMDMQKPADDDHVSLLADSSNVIELPISRKRFEKANILDYK